MRQLNQPFGAEFGEDGFKRGMHLARQIAMTSYRSSEEFNGRFGRDKVDNIFEIENYLEHQGEKIINRFSPHSYLTLTKAMEQYDITDTIVKNIQSCLISIKHEAPLQYAHRASYQVCETQA